MKLEGLTPARSGLAPIALLRATPLLFPLVFVWTAVTGVLFTLYAALAAHLLIIASELTVGRRWSDVAIPRLVEGSSKFEDAWPIAWSVFHIVALAAALSGMKINSPFGADGTITMRDDHTTIGYAIGWGQTTPKEPFIIDIKPADWGRIVELETEWKKQKNYI